MEQSQEPIVKVDSAPQKMSKKQIIGMVILAVIALAGVAFGIFGMNEKNRIEKDLTIKIKEPDGEITEIEADNITSTAEGGTIVEITDTNTVNPTEYIYIGEWGLKIKIPEELSSVSYEFSHMAGYTQVTVWAADCSNGKCQYFPGFASPQENRIGLGAIRRYPKGTELNPGSQPVLVFSDENYDYRFAHVQVTYTAWNDIQSELEWEGETVKIVSRMLESAESYSKF